MDHTKIPFNVEIIQQPVTKQALMEELNTDLYTVSFELPKLSLWALKKMQANLKKLMNSFLAKAKRVCDSAIANKELPSRLQAAKFDVCIADTLNFCGELVAELFNIPFI